MARKQRIHLPGGLYHVMLRGNEGQNIFFIDDDRRYFEALVAEGIERFGHRVHAYCWMSNHVHLAIQVKVISLSKIIQNLSFRYTRYIHKRENRMGHLFQGRYKAILVDSDSYLPQLVRYIHLNPVRAALTTDPAQYSWSGHRAYLNRATCQWLTRDWVLSLFAKRENTAIKRYSQFVLEGREQDGGVDFQKGQAGGRVLGDELFIEKVLTGNRETHPRKVSLNNLVKRVCHHYDLLEAEVLSPSRRRDCVFVRNVISFLWMNEYDRHLKEWADYCGKDLSSLSRNLTAFKASSLRDEISRQVIMKIIQ